MYILYNEHNILLFYLHSKTPSRGLFNSARLPGYFNLPNWDDLVFL